MAKITQAKLERELEQVLTVLKGLPGGAFLETIRTQLDQSFPERTLSRYLTILQQQGKVRASGATRSRLYHWIPDTPTPASAEPGKAQTIIPLSPEGQVIRQYLTLPLTNRKAVGYKLEFLICYRPNVDIYLNL